MTNTLFMTLGLPGSGKSFWAEAQVRAHPAGYAVRINRDSLRTMLHADRWDGKRTEQTTAAARDALIAVAMSQGVMSIYCDDTNLDPKVQARLRELARAGDYKVEVQDFRDVPIETCIARDLKRERSVGEQVIRKMWRRYIESPHARVDPPADVAGAPSAVIVDLDGTVALMTSRGPYETTKYDTDAPNAPVVRLVQDLYAAGESILFCSGRDAVARDQSIAWIEKHMDLSVSDSDDASVRLFMRPQGDKRKDSIVKKELWEQNIKGRYNVRFVLDDRNQVVDAWRELGLTCFQVAPGDF